MRLIEVVYCQNKEIITWYSQLQGHTQFTEADLNGMTHQIADIVGLNFSKPNAQNFCCLKLDMDKVEFDEQCSTILEKYKSQVCELSKFFICLYKIDYEQTQ